MKVALAVRPVLAKLVRLLASDSDGEALGAVRALGRALRANGLDFHDLAREIETPAAPSSDVHNHFDDDSAETWETMVDACVDQPDRFTSKEQQFLESMQTWYGEPTQKQLDWLAALFKRVRRAA